jgi:hypothetical protein
MDRSCSRQTSHVTGSGCRGHTGPGKVGVSGSDQGRRILNWLADADGLPSSAASLNACALTLGAATPHAMVNVIL